MPEVSSVSRDASYTKSLGGPGGALGKEAFMQLLVTQLRYQDPLAPMENTEFIAQLAQFSSLEQLWNVSANTQTNTLLLQSLQNTVLSGFVDREVWASGGKVWLPDEGDVTLHYTLGGPAQVTVEVLNEAGLVVRTLLVGLQGAGETHCTWDGRNSAGQRLSSGTYSFRVKAVDESGAAVTATPYTVGTVTGVRFKNGNALLLLGGLEVSPSDLVLLR
ncbi:MAG: flagellar hook assembly protein FlgD [candidate division KSB1 bacterium]|nr:flagellar hook assembly protein FlgD [candidate division KSB1 bacterium]MDZ7377946.1 flagellar hook assembly protein FlgD [candidate division KSB1 bacterium]MDZ7393379.1 flagellar hook assembly protein FlgD [candidate division KSB1 bacterium]